jgi:hypothetical protein
MTEPAPHTLPKELLKRWKPCDFCGQRLRAGYTNKDKVSWFDDEPPHANHWVTCPKRDVARQHFGKRHA